MANAKRASMRGGPLADLFRKTTDANAQETPEQAAVPEATPAMPPPISQQPVPTPVEEVPVKPEELELPLTPISEPAPAPAASEEPMASPPERLRQVFSSSIPARPEEAVEPAAPARPEPVAEVATPAPPVEREPEPAPVAPVSTSAPIETGDHHRERESGFSAAAQAVSAKPTLRVVGVGGAGVNAVNRMVEAGIEDVEFLALNTDIQSLESSLAHRKLHVGESLTRGLGSGSNPAVGRDAAKYDVDAIKSMLKGSDMVFIAAGAGGGTGTGAAPVVARVAREVGALTVAIVTKPFSFEGSRRLEQADEGIDELAAEVDTLIVVPNNKLLAVLDKQTSMVEAFRVADDVLRQGVQGISDLVTLPGLINLDFADVRTIMSDAGAALLGIGMGVGENRAADAAAAAVSSPLLETSVEGARSILLSITGGPDLSLWEVNEAAKAIAESAHPDANIIFGAMVDEKLEEEVWVTVVATRFRERPIRRAGERGGSIRAAEPVGEIKARRVDREDPRREAKAKLAVSDLNIPEFVPKG